MFNNETLNNDLNNRRTTYFHMIYLMIQVFRALENKTKQHQIPHTLKYMYFESASFSSAFAVILSPLIGLRGVWSTPLFVLKRVMYDVLV